MIIKHCALGGTYWTESFDFYDFDEHAFVLATMGYVERIVRFHTVSQRLWL